MSNKYLMQRGWMDNPVFAPEPFTEREAFSWMIETAVWKDCRARCGNVIVNLKRGQLAYSERYLAGKWLWTKSRVHRFLNRLKIESLIESETNQLVTIITICQYEELQDFDGEYKPQSEPVNGPVADQSRTSREPNKNTLNTGITPENTSNPPTPQGGESVLVSEPVVEKPVEQEPAKPKKSPEAQIAIPDYVPEQLLNDFFTHRKAMKKPMTAHARQLLLNKIIELYNKGHDPTKLLEEAILRGWQTVYESEKTLTNGAKNESFQQSNARHNPQSKSSFQREWDTQQAKNLAFIADLERKAAAEKIGSSPVDNFGRRRAEQDFSFLR